MSPHAASSLITDLVEMAKSHEELPKVRMDLQDANVLIISHLDTILRLELKLIEAHNETQDCLSRIRSLEVARDDAELRFLEAEDRTEKAVAFVRTVFGNAGQLLQALEPPKPEPEIVSAAKELSPEAPLPLSEVGLNVSTSSDQKPAQEAELTGSTSSSEASGESVVDPTASLQSGSESQTASSQDAGSEADAGLPEPNKGPYSGKRYHDHAFYVSLPGWLEGGGTQEDYHWRP